MLSVNNIKAVYADVVLALDGMSLTLESDSIVALLGSNGSGKSTTLKSISGVLRVEEGKLSEGSVEFDGKRIDKLAPEQIARLGVRHVLQGRSVFPQLTIEENLLMGAYLRKNKQEIKSDMERVYSYFPSLTPLQTRKSGYLSGGEQQMLSIGRTLMGRPRLILLDEPSLGLAPGIIENIFTILNQIKTEQKTSFLIAEQNSIVLSIADYGYVLQTGKVVSSGDAVMLRDHNAVKEAYLGIFRDEI
ncbi:MAG: ABC transporter ATP-binding protein [Chloroflexi bacterium]|jgi:branched-chain amino acid transport system ATP-binding protein|nr:ABC transporter ATP-binding protein [Chloroflexota bacterium]MBT7080474.1 ABC transporter ATP-binding protein [Chloroflexota bacterium]MBT7289879.1 ABC transporter ATP-binding protein [Chloroflexota bacterium]